MCKKNITQYKKRKLIQLINYCQNFNAKEKFQRSQKSR